MSDSEDQSILEDIRALENALFQKNAPDSVSQASLKREIISVNDHHLEEIETFTEPSPNTELVPIHNEEALIQDSATALKFNQDLIERLMSTRNEVAEILEQCRRKREIVNSKIKSRLKLTPSGKTYCSHAGMPYFKDKDFFAAPQNEDTKLKNARGELQIIHLRRVSRWTAKDKEVLLKAIHLEAVNGLKNLEEDEEDEVEKMTMGKSHSLPNVVIKAIGPLGTREFDWMKIAVTDFQNKHSPEECRVMWNVFLHPDINKFKWKKKELSDLEKLVKKYKYENWNLIAKKLGTQRSGYQCFVKFNTIKREPLNDKPWKKQEDNKLIQLVNKFRIGDFINWGDVASCVEKRTKQQIYFRWTYSLAPHLKKGRFTEQEDKLLIDAIEKYGLNFKKISALVLPTRTTAQLNDHYNTIANKDGNVWSIEQDTKLLKLYKEHGRDWAKIATFFDTKSRVQLRHRHAALIRYEKRGITLNQLPRINPQDKGRKEILVFQKVPVNSGAKIHLTKELDEVDMELIEYFQSVNSPSSKIGRKQKFYSGKELESSTRKLYNILQLMSANLKIPYDLDEFDCLTEKDKQLLTSLKNLPHDATYGACSRKVEQMRLMMFDCGINLNESEDQEEEAQHFIPPLPFGGYMKSNKTHRMINYSLYIDTSFLVDREMVFDTPANVIGLIGENTNFEFDKLGKLLVRPNYKSEKQSTQSIYILTPEDFIKRGLVNRMSEVQHKNQYLPSTSRSTNSEIRILNPNNIKEFDMDNFPAMKPNFETLRGFQALSNVMKTMKADNENECPIFEERKMPERGRVALDLLRTRLVQLFKYPIIMSQVMPPESIDEQESLFLTEEESNVHDGPKRKRRKLTKKK